LRDALVLSTGLCPNKYNHENINEIELVYAQKYWDNLQIAKNHAYKSDWVIGKVSKVDFDIDVVFTTVDFPKFCCWAVTDVQLAELPHEMQILGGDISMCTDTEIVSTPTDRIVAPPQKSQVACNAILDAIRQLGYEPLNLPENTNGKKGVKDKIRKFLDSSSLFKHGTVFNNTWSKLLETEQIQYGVTNF
jgi:hypothetical protein